MGVREQTVMSHMSGACLFYWKAFSRPHVFIHSQLKKIKSLKLWKYQQDGKNNIPQDCSSEDLSGIYAAAVSASSSYMHLYEHTCTGTLMCNLPVVWRDATHSDPPLPSAWSRQRLNPPPPTMISLPICPVLATPGGQAALSHPNLQSVHITPLFCIAFWQRFSSYNFMVDGAINCPKLTWRSCGNTCTYVCFIAILQTKHPGGKHTSSSLRFARRR